MCNQVLAALWLRFLPDITPGPTIGGGQIRIRDSYRIMDEFAGMCRAIKGTTRVQQVNLAVASGIGFAAVKKRVCLRAGRQQFLHPAAERTLRVVARISRV
jgi:hypothetical protein